MTVSDPVDHRSTEAGNDPDNHTDDGAADRKPDIVEPVLDALQPPPADLRLGRDGAVLSQKRNDLGDGEYTKSDDDQFQSIRKVGKIIGRHAQITRRRAFADRPDQHPQTSGNDTLYGDTSRKNANHGKAEDGNHQQFWRAEFQNNWPGNQNEHGQKAGTDKSTEQGRSKGRRKRAGGLTLLGHGKAVQHSSLAGRRPGYSHQDRCKGV